jgi:hypothetical protein
MDEIPTQSFARWALRFALNNDYRVSMKALATGSATPTQFAGWIEVRVSLFGFSQESHLCLSA